MKFWTPNLGARVPTDLNTGVPDYREYLQTGLWRQRRMLRSVSGTGAVTYQPRLWPESLPTAVLQVYDSQRQMLGAGQERPGVPHPPCARLRRGEWWPQDPVRHAAVESAVCCVLPWRREPGAAVVTGADDQQHGRRGLCLAEQLGRQDQ